MVYDDSISITNNDGEKMNINPFVRFLIIQFAVLILWVLSLNLPTNTLIRYYGSMILVLLWCKE